MSKRLSFLVVLFFVSVAVLAQNEPPKKEEPAKQKKTQDTKIKLFIKIVDYVDGKEYRWRISEFIVKETFLIASLERKEEFIKKRIRRYRRKKKYRNKTDEEMRKIMEEMWEDLRKKRGLAEWDFSHIEVLNLKKMKKMLREKEEKETEGKEKEKEKPKEGEEKESDDKKELTEDDLRKMADYIIEGEVKSVKAEPSVWLGHTVQYNAKMEGKIKVIDAKSGEVLKEIESKHKMGAEDGQEVAHQRALKSAGLDFAKALINLEVLKKDAKRLKEEKKEKE